MPPVFFSPLHCVSLLPVLLGESNVPLREAIFVLGDGKDSAIAVRSGRWKLIVRYDADRNETYELYDLQKDPGELNNLSNDERDVTRQLATALANAEAAGRTRD